LSTIGPFARRSGIEIAETDDLRERNIAGGVIDNFREVWLRSWEDFSFSLPGCESSSEAQERFVEAVRQILRQDRGVIGISTHGAVLALLLNHLDPTYGPTEADALKNPDVVKLDFLDGELSWDRQFHLPGIHDVATHHDETPIDW
jgi:2,3-bisphosphoglycerate-dependent phosphoglycerate mutase